MSNEPEIPGIREDEDLEVARIVELINRAFDGVPRGKMTMREAEVVDSTGTAAERRAARALDTEARWQDIPDELTEVCCNAMSFFDPESWRYYLPVYMCWTLRSYRTSDWITSDFTIYHLGYSDARALERNATLSQTQAAAVFEFLRHMATTGECDFEAAQQAIDVYWHRFAPQSP